MTCIVGIVNKDGVYIGGDSAAISSEDLSYNIRTDTKVFLKGEFIIGFSTSFRMGQLLRYKFRIPAHPKGMDTHQFMATLFIDAVKKCFDDNGYNEMTTGDGGCIMVGYKGCLFTILPDYQVSQAKENYASLGCGELIALGAMNVLSALGILEKEPEKKIEMVLNATVAHSMGVKPPFTIEKILNRKRTTKKTK